MALLRFDGGGRFSGRRLCHLPARSQGRERSAGPQILAQKSGQSLQDLRAMGIRRHCHPCLTAAPCAHGSVSACGGRHAISAKKIPGSAHARPNLQIHDPGLFGRALWTANHCVHRGTRTPRRGGNHFGADYHCHRGFLLLARQQEQERTCTFGERFFGRDQSPSRAGQRSAGSRSRAARHRN